MNTQQILDTATNYQNSAFPEWSGYIGAAAVVAIVCAIVAGIFWGLIHR